MESQVTGQVPDKLLSYAVDFIELARGAETVGQLFETASDAIRKIVPDTCLCLWMEDKERQRICLAHRSRPASGDHQNVPLWFPADGSLEQFFADDWHADADWRKEDHFEGVSCRGSLGMAYLRLETFDGLRLLVTACVPAKLKESHFAFHREYFRLFGQALVQAIERIRLKCERDVLSKIGTLPAHNETRREFFDRAARRIAEAFAAEGCSIFIYNKYGDNLVLGGTTGLFKRQSERSLNEEELPSLTYCRGEGITGWIFANQRTVRLYDAEVEDEWNQFTPPIKPVFKSSEKPKTQGSRPFLGVPVFNGDRFCGVLRIHGRQTPALFLPSDERRLESVSVELGRAIANWNAEFEARDSLQREKEVQEKLRTLPSETTLRAALDTIAEQTKQLFQGCAASVLLSVPNKDELIVVSDVADRKRLDRIVTIPFSKGLCGHAAIHRQTIAVPDVTQCQLFYALDDIRPGALQDVKSEAATPILLGEKVLGVLNVDSDRLGWFSPDDSKLQMLERLASHAARVIDRELFQAANDTLNLTAKGLLHLFNGDLTGLNGLISDLSVGGDNEHTIKKLAENSARLSRYWHELYRTPVFDRPDLQPQYLNDFVERAIGMLKDLARTKSISVETDLAPDLCRPSEGGTLRVALDPLLFQIVISNLFTNAIKACRDNGIVRITTEHRDHKTAVLAVQDSGIGVPDEHKKRLFVEPFSTTGGAGSGLLLVGRIVRVHGGHVRFESQVGQGSTFIVEFPIIRDNGVS